MGRPLIILVLLALIQSAVQGQSHRPYTLITSDTTLLAHNEERVQLLLRISNTTDIPLNGFIEVLADTSLNVLSKSPLPVTIAANANGFASVSVYVTRKAKSGVANTVKFILQDSNKNKLAEVTSIVNVLPSHKISLFSSVSSILLDDSRDRIIIPVQILNSGNSEETLNLVCAYPSTVTDETFHQTVKVKLPPSSDTTITFSKPVTKRMINSDGFDIMLSGIYTNGDLAGSTIVQVQSVQSSRNYHDELEKNSFIDNYVQGGFRLLPNHIQAYILRGAGGVELGQERLNYNINLTSWKNGYALPLLQSTWLDYGNNRRGIRIGNLNRNLDLNLTGRGVAAHFATSQNHTWEAGLIDKENNLLGTQNGASIREGNGGGWLSYSYHDKNWRTSNYIVMDNDPIQGIRSQLVGNEFNFTGKQKINYSFSLNGGRVSTLQNNAIEKFGMSIAAYLQGQLGKVNLSSSNFMSSGYYPGIQKGALNFSERINWSLSKINIWWNLDYRSYNPRLISTAQYTYSAKNFRAEWGLLLKHKKSTISLAPVFTYASGTTAYLLANENTRRQSISAWNMLLNLTLSAIKNGSFSLNTEFGKYTSGLDSSSRFHLRTNLFYRKGLFNLSGSAQIGAFYVNELIINNFSNSRHPISIFNVTPSVQKSFFAKRLTTRTGLTLNYNSIFGFNQFFRGRIDWVAGSKTNFYTSLNYNRNASRVPTQTLEIGIVHHFSVAKSNLKTNRLEIVVYKDLNQDGIYNENDSVAAGFMINIANKLFVTDKTGHIIYKNLPDQTVSIAVPFQQGWHAPEQQITLQKKTVVAIPLHITGTLKGRVNYGIRNQFSHETTSDLMGIPLLATDKNGRRFQTKTAPDGSYAFYIPIGEYTISIETSELSSELEVPDNRKEIKIRDGNIVTTDFILEVKQKKIQIKKFTSPSASRSLK